MAESRPRSDADQGTPPRMPRWAKVAAIIAGLLILVFLILQLTGIAGDHGPGRHMLGATTTTVGAPAAVNASAATVLA